jgi:anti-sigma28 factor (negative regulator of flagellin synthesis)
MRVGQKQKKIDINIPKLDDFIHKTYINVARKIYKNVYLFETNIAPLSVQKHYRELEIIVQECILNTLRESIPVESILKAYMDETVEEDVIEEIKEQITEEPIRKPLDAPLAAPVANNRAGLSFNDIDYVKTDDGSVSNVNAPKSIERLEEISQLRNQQRKMDEEEDDNNAKLKISDQVFNLDSLDVHNIEEPRLELLPDLLIDDIEVLE